MMDLLDRPQSLTSLVSAFADAGREVLASINPQYNLDTETGAMIYLVDTDSRFDDMMCIGSLLNRDMLVAGNYAAYCADWLLAHPDQITSQVSGSRINAIRAGKFVIALMGLHQVASQRILVELALRTNLIDQEYASRLLADFFPKGQVSPGQALADHFQNNPADNS